MKTVSKIKKPAFGSDWTKPRYIVKERNSFIAREREVSIYNDMTLVVETIITAAVICLNNLN